MKLRKIVNSDTIQAYQILSPSSLAKRMFSKKYTFCFRSGDKALYTSANALPFAACLPTTVGYIFTYQSKLPPMIGKMIPKDEISTFPLCLDQYFNYGTDAKKDKPADLIMICKPEDRSIMPLTMTQDVIVRTNSSDLLSKPDIQQAVLDVVNQNLEHFDSLERWMFTILTTCPLTKSDLPVKYQSTISQSDFTSKSKNNVAKGTLFIGYDYRALDAKVTYEYENKLICAIEDAFQKRQAKLVIHNNYNFIVDRMKKQLKKQKLPFKDVITENAIIITYDTLSKLNMKFDLTDFM